MNHLSTWSFPLFVMLLLFTCDRNPGNYATPKFEAQVIDDAIQIGYGIGIGDVDGDGKKDILLADKKQFVWYRNGDWERFVMVDNLTERDNVCLAVRDINGDGRVEVAVGAQWNPGETSDVENSGSVHYLIRPDDPTQEWKAVPLPHEPTVHRMHWVKVGSRFHLVVLPLHGRGNRNGEGNGVRILAYEMPDDPQQPWPYHLLDSSMHMTHNFEVIEQNGTEALLIGGKEGALMIAPQEGKWPEPGSNSLDMMEKGFGEIRKTSSFIAGIQPMHGNELKLFFPDGNYQLLEDSLRQGHALACADLIKQGREQIIVGWREENEQREMGIKLFLCEDPTWEKEKQQVIWIDRNGMACEDLKIADLDSDGKPDIIAAGRDTRNLKIYWNQSR